MRKEFTVTNGLTTLIAAAVVFAAGSTALMAEGDRGKYWVDPRTGEVWTINGECVTTSDWTEEDAIMECHPDLVEAEEPEPAAREDEPTPEVVTRTETRRETIDASALFAFGSDEMTADGRRAVEASVRTDPDERIESVTVVGHTDRIGNADYNDALSQRRAEAVVAYLRTLSGMEDIDLEARGVGSRSPVVDCEDRSGDALIECLAPNRRVELEVTVSREVEVRQ